MKEKSLAGWLAASLFTWGCGSVQVAGDVQAGRNALQTRRAQDAVVYLARAANEDPNYKIPYRLGENVLTYLGRAYYETGSDKDAQATLEKALARDDGDHIARLYLGLTLLRGGDKARGEKELQSGLRGIYGLIESLAADPLSGPYWDPGRQIRGDIERATTLKSDSTELVSLGQSIGKSVDEETDRVRREEARTLFSRGGDS